MAGSGVTDANGKYEITKLDYGDYLVTVGSESSAGVASKNVTLSSATPSGTLSFVLPVVGSIRGTVTDSNGTTPLARVPVTLFSGTTPIVSGFTDDAGRYRFDVLAVGTYSVQTVLEGKGFSPRTGLALGIGTSLTGINLVAGNARVRGVVRNAATGQPIAEARLHISGDGINGLTEFATAADGSYEFFGPPSAKLQIVARAPGVAYQVLNTTLSSTGPVVANFSLGTATLFTGTVRDTTTGMPISRAVVQLRNQAGPAEGPFAATNSSGQFSVDGLPAGVYDIVVVAPAHQTLVLRNQTIGGATFIRDVSLGAASISVSGFVRDAGGRALAGVSVQGFDATGLPIGWTTTGIDGSYKLDNLPEGTITLTANTAGGGSVSLPPVTVVQGSTRTGDNFVMATVAIAAASSSSGAAVATAASIISSATGQVSASANPECGALDRVVGLLTLTACVPPKRLPDEAVLPPLPPGPNCIRVIEAFREAEARIRNRDNIFDAWAENFEAGRDLRSANAKLLTAQGLVFAGNLAKIGLKVHALTTEVTQAGQLAGLGPSATESFLRILNGNIGLIDTYIVKGRDLILALAAAIEGTQLGGIDDIVGQLSGILGAVRDLAERIIGDVPRNTPWGTANPLFDIFLDVVGFIKDTISAGMDIVAAYKDSRVISGNTDLAKDLYIRASVNATFAVEHYQWELAHCMENDPKVDRPDQVPLPIWAGGPGAGGSSASVGIPTSLDPNDKTTTAGFGASRFITAQVMPFRVDFENDPTLGATVPAQEVFVTDPLDADLDLTTVEFTSFGFDNRVFDVPAGLSRYETTIDLRPDGINLLVPVVMSVNPQTRILSATFRSLDPLTGLPPDDVDSGFLPVNNKALHNGEGFFTYNIRPLPGRLTGTDISNQASIVFDVNAPILTPITRNTLDTALPTSQVSALPTKSAATFNLSWSGTDPSNGSGVSSYDIFVSQNGGPFTPFLVGTTATTGVFQGVSNTTYAFYSVATDNVGLREATPVTSDAQTLTSILLDFGDAPDPNYPTLFTRNGASHVIGALRLGTSVDAEVDGQPSIAADGDGADEDGVFIVSDLVTSSTAATTSSVRVVSSASGKLDAWIDFNGNGVFDNPSERIGGTSSINVAAGENLISLNVPIGSGAKIGDTYARFRLSTVGGLLPTGVAADGEVEDYRAKVVAASDSATIDIKVPAGETEVVAEGANLIVRRGTTVLFKAPFTSFGALQFGGTPLDDILRLTILQSLTTDTLLFDGGSGTDFLKLNEAGQTLDLTTGKVVVRDLEGVDITGTGDNKLILDLAKVKTASTTTDRLSVVFNAGDTIQFGTGFIADLPQIVSGLFTHIIKEASVGGTAEVYVRNDRAYQNPLNRFDADRDGTIRPSDALRIINEIRRRGAGPLVTPTTSGQISKLYFDVSGNNSLTALDALQIINAIARIIRGGQAEGERQDDMNSRNQAVDLTFTEPAFRSTITDPISEPIPMVVSNSGTRAHAPSMTINDASAIDIAMKTFDSPVDSIPYNRLSEELLSSIATSTLESRM